MAPISWQATGKALPAETFPKAPFMVPLQVFPLPRKGSGQKPAPSTLEYPMKKISAWLILFASALLLAGCFGSSNSGTAGTPAGAPPQPAPVLEPIIVNSLIDDTNPPAGVMTLRLALAQAADSQPIVFDAALNGGVIALSIVGEEHSVLKGEVMGMRDEPSGPVSYLEGYFERDYGRSALYARKTVIMDASALDQGITLAWTGGANNPARVLAVFGNLTLKNITITGGHSIFVQIDPVEQFHDQPFTLARGAGVAVWGTASIENCTIYDNHCSGDFQSSRDRGAFGGGLYADIVFMENSVVSGNTVSGAGAGGGGVCSVGGANSSQVASVIKNSSITGNRISGVYAYGGGVYSDGGGIGNSKGLELVNCTIAENVADYPPLPPQVLNIGYWRGSAAYMSNGTMFIQGCTIVGNQVYGKPRVDSLGKPNLAGAVAATIGNAHAVEDMTVGHSILVGNTVHESTGAVYGQDIFTGSLMYFTSMGHNRIGVVEFGQILVPVGAWGWRSLCRKHYPKQGDEDGVVPAAVLNLADGVTRSDFIACAGANAPGPAVLHYEPGVEALDKVPPSYFVEVVLADYFLNRGAQDNFLEIMLGRLENHYNLPGFAAAFTQNFETFLANVDLDPNTPGNQPYTDPDGNPILTLADTGWFGPALTWPKELYNYPFIYFWRQLDAALVAANIPGMGPEILGDANWKALFESGALAENAGIRMRVITDSGFAALLQEFDQLGNPRPAGILGDIGAIEMP